MIEQIKKFFSDRTVTTHTLVAAFTTLVVLYGSVPAFQSLVNQAYAATPHWVHDAATAALGIWMFYHPSKG